MTHQFKFGVLYCKKGQSSEEQMLSNSAFVVAILLASLTHARIEHEDASADYLAFLKWLGQTVELQGWSFFAGGLDTKRM